MSSEDRVLLNLLYRLLRACEPSRDGDMLRLSFSVLPDEQEQRALDKARILLKLDSLGDDLWVTADAGNTTVMLPLDGIASVRAALSPGAQPLAVS